MMEEIAKRRPVDRTAALVTQPGPRGLDSAKRIACVFSPTPLPTRPVPRGAVNLTGQRCGQLTVIGLARDIRHLWVCRCVCGYYVTRKAKAIKNTRNQDIDRCERCRELAWLKRQDARRSTGRYGNEQSVAATDGSGRGQPDPFD